MRRSPSARRVRVAASDAPSRSVQWQRLEFGFEHADARQIAVAFGEIQSVTDNEFVRDFEADEIRLELDLATGLFIEEDAAPQAGGPQLFGDFENPRESFSSVEDVIDDQNVTIGDIERKIGEDLRRADGFRFCAVAGNADTIETHGIVDFTHEIGGEHDRAVDQGDDGELTAAVEALDITSELVNAPFDLFLGVEDRGEIWMNGGKTASPR